MLRSANIAVLHLAFTNDFIFMYYMSDVRRDFNDRVRAAICYPDVVDITTQSCGDGVVYIKLPLRQGVSHSLYIISCPTATFTNLISALTVALKNLQCKSETAVFS